MYGSPILVIECVVIPGYVGHIHRDELKTVQQRRLTLKCIPLPIFPRLYLPSLLDNKPAFKEFY